MTPQESANILLARWQAQRSMPPGLRVLDGDAPAQRNVDPNDTFERDLAIIRQVMARK